MDISPEAGVSPATTSNQGDISQQRLKLLDGRSFILLDLGDLGREVVLGNGISGGNSYLSLSIYLSIYIYTYIYNYIYRLIYIQYKIAKLCVLYTYTYTHTHTYTYTYTYIYIYMVQMMSYHVLSISSETNVSRLFCNLCCSQNWGMQLAFPSGIGALDSRVRQGLLLTWQTSELSLAAKLLWI